MQQPSIKPGDTIYVQGVRCIVMRVFKPEHWTACMVVFNPTKPTTHDVDWDEEHGRWVFPERPDFGGYGRDTDPFVRQLRNG